MVNSQEIIERSIYSALLGVAVKLGYSVNPEDFLPINAENSKKFKEAISKLKKFVQVFGTGNNQSKDKKETPRIVVNARGFYPGSIGLPRELITKEEGIGFTATEYPYETIDQYIDIHLVAGTQEDLRLLHQIMFYAIPQRGYIKPYTEDSFLFTGNIFIELVNFFDIPNLDMGLLEKIYQFQVMDCILEEIPGEVDFVPITTIDVLLENYGYTLLEVPEKELPPYPPPVEEDIVYGSGKKFPIWNSMAGTDKIKSFKLLGYTVQEGTPTPEAPIPLLSVGDEGLKLCISGSETGVALQVVDFGDIVLRSIPKGICDSIEWDGKNWRHVQRVGYVKITPDDIVSVSKIDTSHTNYYVRILGVNKGIISNDFKYFRANTKYVNHYMCNKFTYAPIADILNTWYLVENSSILSGWVITDKPTKEEFLELIGDGFEFIGELAEPVETILEGIPAPQTSDNETWFGTPPASVKPYMMCECKVKKALKYQGDISAWWYFGGNKSNETDRQITDISGNGNDLTPYNFAWTRESGWDQGGICSDGIDDYLKVLLKEPIYTNDGFTIQLSIKILKNTSYDNIAGFVTGIKGGGNVPRDPNRSIGSITNINNNNNNNYRAIANSNVQIANNNYKDGTIYAKFKSDNRIITNGLSSVINPDIADESDNDFRVGYSGGDYFEILLLKGYVNEDIVENNKKLLLQRNGVDGDINIG